MKNSQRKETTEFLSKLLISSRLSGMGKYYASEVTLGYGTGKGKEKRVDFIQFVPQNQYSVSGLEKGEFIFYEVKSCKEDYHSGHGLTFEGDKNYLVTTMQTYKDLLPEIRTAKFSYYTGVMVAVPADRHEYDEFEKPTPIDTPNTNWRLHIINSAHPHSRERSMTELLFCMLRSGK